MFGQFGIAGDALSEEVLDAGIGRNFHRLLRVTNGVLQSSKKEHVEADGIGVFGGHMGIVAPGRDCGKRRGCGGFGHSGGLRVEHGAAAVSCGEKSSRVVGSTLRTWGAAVLRPYQGGSPRN